MFFQNMNDKTLHFRLLKMSLHTVSTELIYIHDKNKYELFICL